MTNQKKLQLFKYLRLLRDRAKLNQEEAAKLLEVSRRTYQDMEYGNAPITDWHINRMEAAQGLIEFNCECPHCGFLFKL